MKLKTNLKKGISIFLAFVLAFQPTFTSAAAIEGRADVKEAYPITGNPKEAFDALTVSFLPEGNPAVSDTNTLDLRVKGTLNNDYLMNHYMDFLDNDEDACDEDDFDNNYEGVQDRYSSYDQYLEAQDSLKAITFSFTLTGADAYFPAGKMSGDIITDGESEVIGVYEAVTEGKKTVVKGTFKKLVYNRFNVTFGQNIRLDLEELYDQNSTVTVAPPSGAEDSFGFEINGTPIPPGDSGYEMSKKAKTKNPEDTSIVYQIVVQSSRKNFINSLLLGSEASASEATGSEATGSEASGSEASNSNSNKKKDSDEEAAEEEEEEKEDEYDPRFDDEAQEDGYNGPGLVSLLKELLPPTDRRLTNGFLDATSGFASIVSLGGTRIVDKIPEGLVLKSVKVKYGKEGEFSSADPADYSYDEASREFIFTLPDLGTEEEEYAELEIETELSDDVYNDYMMSGKPFYMEFPNKAVLKGDAGTLAISKCDPVPFIKLGAPFNKEGGFIDSKTEPTWTLTVNSFFSNGETILYAVDHIQDIEKTHTYKIEGGITIGREKKEIVKVDDPSIPADSYSYDKIKNIGVIEEFLETYVDAADDKASPIVYQYEKDGNINQVMLIPLSAYKNQELKITYQTSVAVSLDDFASGTDGPIERTIQNEAKILWRWPAGYGPGKEDYGSATIGKDYTASYSLVEKSGKYDAAKNIVTWDFVINQFGAEIDAITITDELIDSKLLLVGPDPNNPAPLRLILKDSSRPGGKDGEAVEVSYVEPTSAGSSPGNYYTIKKEGTGSDAKTTFILYLANITPGQVYEFQIETYVSDENLDGNGSSVPVKNTAKVHAVVKGKDINFDVPAECPVKTTLVRKSAMEFEGGGFYHYEDHTVKWSITANPMGLTVTNPMLKDELPEGVIFNDTCAVTKVVYGGDVLWDITNTPDPGAGKGTNWSLEHIDGNFKIQAATDQRTSANAYSDQTLDFKFTSTLSDGSPVTLKKPITFEFTTFVEEPYRKAVFKSDVDNKLTNEVIFQGNLNGNAAPFKATDKAENNLNLRPMIKNGAYHPKTEYSGTIEEAVNPEVDFISWTLYVNRTCADMTGAVIKDQMIDCMELIPGSVKIYAVTLDSTGKEIGDAQDITSADNLDAQYDHFTYTVPASYGTKTLKLAFDTVMVDDALASEIDNRVSISGNGWSDQTGQADVEKKQNFYLSSYATAQRLYFAKIYKTSENEATKFPLKGAKFEITKLKKNSGDGSDIEDWVTDNTGFPKARISNKRGNINFMFLSPDAMYKIVETASPPGYALAADPADRTWYVVPKKTSAGITYPGLGDKIIINEAAQNYVTMKVKNSVQPSASGTLQFKKTGQNGQALPGVAFEISYKKLKFAPVESNSNGIVDLTHLDPIPETDYYTIKEITPYGYKDGATLKVKVFLDTDGTVQSEFMKPNALIEENNAGKISYTLKNEERRAKGSFSKVDQNGDLIGREIKFKILRRGDGGKTETDNSVSIVIDVDQNTGITDDARNQYFDYLLEPEIRSATGIFTFEDFVYGDYKLEEQFPAADSDSPFLNTTNSTFYIRVDKDGVFAYKDEAFTEGTGKKLAETDGKGFSFENDMKYGYIQVNKVLGERSADGTLKAAEKDGKKIPIPGAKFEIYRDLNKDAVLNDNEKNQKVMALKTNGQGNFTVDMTTGFYTTADNKEKKLILGNYILKEISAEKNDYIIPDKTYAFSLTAQDQTLYIDSKTDAADNKPANLFLNEPKRGTVSLKKVDADYKDTTLSGAEFDVYLDGASPVMVASLKENTENSGDYVLDLPTGASASPRDPLGRNYLERAKDSEPYALLYGTYYLKETKAPTTLSPNYELPPADKKYPFKVEQENVTSLTGEQYITNTIKKQPVEIQKLVEQREASGSQSIFEAYINGAGFTFQLSQGSYSGPVNMPGNGIFEKTATTAINGEAAIASFKDVPVGTYLLKETGIPANYGTMDKPYIELMPDIKVTVTENGVTYEYADKDALGTIAAESGDVDKAVRKEGAAANSTKGNMLVVRNNFKLGSASGIKKGLYNESAAPLNGANFTLRNKEENVAGDLSDTSGTTTRSALLRGIKAASDGTISFTKLPYGTYVLTETKAPDGYKKMEPIELTIDGDNITITNAAMNGTNEKIIKNEAILKSLKFTKMNQNGEAIGADGTTVTFKITPEPSSSISIPDYTAPSPVKNNGEGVITIENLVYGTYIVKEQETPDKVEGELPSFKITVEKDRSEGAVEQTQITLLMDSKEVSLSKPDHSTEIYDFSEKFKVENTRKYGFVAINKREAEAVSGGVSDGTRSLGGIEFEIYRKTGAETEPAAGALPYAKLVTGDNGDFRKNSSNRYIDANGNIQNYLLTGNYFIKEVVPEDYREIAGGKKYTEFAIADQKTTSFSYNGEEIKVFSDTAAPQEPFYNVVKRGSITVNKKEPGEAKLLSGAAFLVSTDTGGEETVAGLKESDKNPGTYVLHNQLPDGTNPSLMKNKAGISYLHQDPDSKEWRLLAGTYYVTEVKAPNGYKKQTGPKKAVVLDETPGVTNTPIDFENELAKVNVKLLKANQNGEIIKLQNDGSLKTTFMLERLNSNADGESPLDMRAKELIAAQAEVHNNSDGMIEIRDLVAGAYRLTEKEADWYWNPVTCYLIVEQSASEGLKVTISDRLDYTDSGAKKSEVTAVQNATGLLADFTAEQAMAIVNEVRYGLLDIKKTAADDEIGGTVKPIPEAVLSNVVFKLYEDKNKDGAFTEVTADPAMDESTAVLTLVTGADGRFKKDSQNRYLDEAETPQDYRLLYGKQYLLKEHQLTAVQAGQYRPDDNYYVFTVGDEIKASDAPLIYYLGTDKTSGVSAPDDTKGVTEGLAGENKVFPNAPLIRGTVVLEKSDSETAGGGGKEAVTGAEFDVYLNQNTSKPVKAGVLRDNNDGKYRLRPGEGYDLTNSAGQEFLKQQADGSYELLSGKYYIKETKAPKGYILPEDTPEQWWYFELNHSDSTITNEDLAALDGQPKEFTNTLWKRTLTINKKTERFVKGTFHTAELSEGTFTFRLKGSPYNNLADIDETVTVGADGTAVFADIPAGTYELSEEIVMADEDNPYILPAPVQVTIDENGIKFNTVQTADGVIEVKNTLKRGSVEAIKRTEDSEGQFALKGAEFELKAMDGLFAGSVFSAKSGQDGKIFFKDVPLGTYELYEISAPEGYEISGRKETVVINAKNETEGQDVIAGVFVNEGFGSISIIKKAEITEAGSISGKMNPGSGFLFRISGFSKGGEAIESFLKESDVTLASSVEIRSGDGVYAVTGDTGQILLNHIPVGSYEIQEIQNEHHNEAGHYVADGTIKQMNVQIDRATGAVHSPQVTVANRLKRGTIQGIKALSDKKTPLKDAVIGLFRADETVFTEETLYAGMKAVSQEDGSFRFEQLPYGTYQVRELLPPDGYLLNTEAYFLVSITEDQAVVVQGIGADGEQSDILIVNEKRPSGGNGGGNGGGGKPDNPKPDTSGPGPATDTPGEPDAPDTPETQQPDEPEELPTIPVEPEENGDISLTPPDTPPGTEVIIKRPDEEEELFRGRTDENGKITLSLEPGDYILTTIDENEVPLANMLFTIEDDPIPLAAFDVGDHSLPLALLAAILLASITGLGILAKKKKEILDEDERSSEN